MKGTIFERGNKFKNKLNRAMAWIRVRKYWLTCSHKEYKKNIFYQVIGVFTWIFGLYIGLWYLMCKLVEWIPAIEGYFAGKKTKKEQEEFED